MPGLRPIILFAVLALAPGRVLAGDAQAAPASGLQMPSGHQMPMPRPRPATKLDKPTAASKDAARKPGAQLAAPLSIAPLVAKPVTTVPVSAAPANVTLQAPAAAAPAARPAPPARSGAPFVTATSSATSPLDLTAVKQAIDLVRKNRAGRSGQCREYDCRSTRAQACGMGDPSQRQRGSNDFSRYAAFIAANPSWPSVVDFAAPGGRRALARTRRPANRHRIFRRRSAAYRQRAFRFGPRAAGARRPRRRGRRGPRHLAHRRLFRRSRNPGARRFRRSDHACRRCGAHGRAALCRGRRWRLERGAASRCRGACRRQGACRRLQSSR